MTQTPIASSHTQSKPPDFVVVGNPGCPRLSYFQAALSRSGLPPATLVSYADLIAGRITLEQVVRRGSVVRLESPGRDFEVEKALIACGAEEPDVDGPTRTSKEHAAHLPFDKGRIWYPRQWYLGFRSVLRRIAEQLMHCPLCRVLTPTVDVEMVFDKPRCQTRFAECGIAVPQMLGPIRCFDELCERMRSAGWQRVFVKLAHGSSASGVVALRAHGERFEALTTVEMVRSDGELRMYNSRLIRRYTRPAEVAELIDTLIREGVQVEQWLPKARLDDGVFDLRIVVIGGKARHVVVRAGQGPMTNLHLGNRRGDLSAVIARMEPDDWQDALHLCEQAAGVFPQSLLLGIDLLIALDYRQSAVLEANAFGGLLPGVLHEGEDTYQSEIRAVLQNGESPLVG